MSLTQNATPFLLTFWYSKCAAGAANGSNGANNGKAAVIPPASPALTPNNSSTSSVKTVALPATPAVKVMSKQLTAALNRDLQFHYYYYYSDFSLHYSVSLLASTRRLWSVWWTTLTTRTRKKTRRRKSNLRGSGPAWALKANCPPFGCSGSGDLSPSHPPSSGRLIGPWPASATCLSQRRAERSSHLPRPWMEGVFLEIKDQSVCSFSLFLPLFITASCGRSPNPFFFFLFSSWEGNSDSLQAHCSSFVTLSCSPSSDLLRTDQRGFGGRNVATAVPSSVAVATGARKLRYYRNPRVSSFGLSLPSISKPNQWAAKDEETGPQPASVPAVHRASQASRTSRRSDRKLDWLKQRSLPRHRTVGFCRGSRGCRQPMKCWKTRGGVTNVPGWNKNFQRRSRTQTYESHGANMAVAHT